MKIGELNRSKKDLLMAHELPYLDTADKAAIANAIRDLKEAQDKAKEQEI